jgi:hypothetical protein
MSPSKLRCAFVIALALSLTACDKAPPTKPERDPTLPMDTLRPAHHIVSFYKLLARPEDFEGKSVQVNGVLGISLGEGAPMLYLNTLAFQYGVTTDAVQLDLTEEQWHRFARLDGRVVAIEGEFRRITRVDDLAPAGTVHVTRLLDLTSAYDPPRNVAGATAAACGKSIKLDAARLRALSATATAYLQKSVGTPVRLEPPCVDNYISATVSTQPIVSGQGVSAAYETTCYNSAPAWSCEGLSGEMAIDGRPTIRLVGQIKSSEALNVVAFLEETAASGGLSLGACGEPERRITLRPSDLNKLKAILRDDYVWEAIVVVLEHPVRIVVGPNMPSATPDARKVCWIPPPPF